MKGKVVRANLRDKSSKQTKHLLFPGGVNEEERKTGKIKYTIEENFPKFRKDSEHSSKRPNKC